MGPSTGSWPVRHVRITHKNLGTPMRALISVYRSADARSRFRRGQAGFTLVELLVVIAILGILAAIVLFNISGVNANAACNGMRTDGATIQGAADLYYNTYGVYPVGNAGVVPPAVLPGAADVGP